MFATVLGLAGWWGTSGCVREAEPFICPPLLEGELVITEIRGPQAGGNDTYGQWIELAYLGADSLDLRGTTIRMRKLDGSGEVNLRVRVPSLEVAPGEYVVLGHHGPELGDIPEYVDASFFADFFSNPGGGAPLRPRDLYDGAVLEVEACGAVIDSVVYRDLPDLGTWSLDGDVAVTEENNDDETAWCNDLVEPMEEGPQLYIGVPGTPGEANRPCP